VNSLANPTAQAVDNVLIYIFGVSLLLLLGITVATIYLVIKYRRSKYPEPTSDVSHSYLLETIWTLLPTLIVVSMFWYGWVNYTGLREVPEGALEVKATARMWSWQFEYPDGRRDNKLFVPVGQPVKVILNSVDVLHNFFIPAFRIKRDTVPGIESYVWFTATEPGSYDIFCAEYCGVGHSAMNTSVEALSEADYASWAQARQQPTGEPRGLTVMNELGCTGCHSLDGSDGIGPSLYQLPGQKRNLLVDGSPVTKSIDEDYLRKAIRQPNDELVEGYAAVMPAYDEATLSEEDLQHVLDYLLGRAAVVQAAKIDAGALLENNGCLSCHSRDGSEAIGPTFKGISQRQVTLVRDGQEVTLKVDADYLRKALLQPNAELVKGYPGIMPAADYLTDDEIEALVQYLLQQ